MALPAWNMPTKGVSLNYNPMKMQIGSANNATNLAAAAIPQPAATAATGTTGFTGDATQALQQQLAALFGSGYGGVTNSWFGGDTGTRSTSLSDWYKR